MVAGFASHNKVAAAGEDIETEFSMDVFPSPDELWQRYKAFRGITDAEESLVTEPYYDDGSKKEPRYCQAEAINRVVERVAGGDKWLLLVNCVAWLRGELVLLRQQRRELTVRD